jgi:hypothetical protein
VKRALANAVVEAIACPCPAHASALQEFRERDWRTSMHWLITSGLALHLLSVLEGAGYGTSIPLRVAARLRALDDASALRTAELRKDFLILNRRLAELGVPFANWKGFALEPEFCVDVRLRPQMDFDFITLALDADRFDTALHDLGYCLTEKTEIEATYEKSPGLPYSLEQVYHCKPQRKVELHFGSDHAAGLAGGINLGAVLERRRIILMEDVAVPVLSREDAFLSHAAHAGRHALEGWVRLGWLFEIDSFIRYHADNLALWRRVQSLSEGDQSGNTTAAIGILLANVIWRRDLPDFLCWVENAIPQGAVQWIEPYGARLAMTEFPGTKLNLLLQRELMDADTWRKFERAALYHRRAIPRVARLPQNATVLQRVRAAKVHLRFVAGRSFFHLTENIRYLLVKRQCARAAVRNRKLAADGDLASSFAARPCNEPVSVDSNSPDA